jgi:hypothetical protein
MWSLPFENAGPIRVAKAIYKIKRPTSVMLRSDRSNDVTSFMKATESATRKNNLMPMSNASMQGKHRSMSSMAMTRYASASYLKITESKIGKL